MAKKVDDVALRAGKEIIGANDLVAFGEKPVAKVGAEKAGTACHENGFRIGLFHGTLPDFQRRQNLNLRLHEPPAALPASCPLDKANFQPQANISPHASEPTRA
jgi:hypothetical protein